VRAIGGKEEKFMKSRIKYTDEPMGTLKIVKDFLPPPDMLILKDEKVKVTLSLSRSSIEFFKKEAEKYHTSYQNMIRQLIDAYTSEYQKIS